MPEASSALCTRLRCWLHFVGQGLERLSWIRESRNA